MTKLKALLTKDFFLSALLNYGEYSNLGENMFRKKKRNMLWKVPKKMCVLRPLRSLGMFHPCFKKVLRERGYNYCFCKDSLSTKAPKMLAAMLALLLL